LVNRFFRHSRIEAWKTENWGRLIGPQTGRHGAVARVGHPAGGRAYYYAV